MSMESKELFVNKRAESGFLQNICRFWPADSWCVSKKVEADFNLHTCNVQIMPCVFYLFTRNKICVILIAS